MEPYSVKLSFTFQLLLCYAWHYSIGITLPFFFKNNFLLLLFFVVFDCFLILSNLDLLFLCPSAKILLESVLSLLLPSSYFFTAPFLISTWPLTIGLFCLVFLFFHLNTMIKRLPEIKQLFKRSMDFLSLLIAAFTRKISQNKGATESQNCLEENL